VRSRRCVAACTLTIAVAIIVLGGCASGSGPTVTSAPPSATTIPTASPSTAFEVVEPADGMTVTTPSVTVRGHGPAGATVVRDISFAPDDKATVAASGEWSMTVALDEGANDLTFRLGEDKASAITITVAFVPDAAQPNPGTSLAPTPDSAVIDALGTYLTENFGSPGYETSWWSHIKAWTVEGDTVVITTDLTTHGEDVGNICSAASGFAFFDEGSAVREGAVLIRAEDGTVIWQRSDVSDPC
jgi:hypothetical protein